MKPDQQKAEPIAPPKMAEPLEVLGIFHRRVLACLDESESALHALENSANDLEALNTLVDRAEMICDLAMVHGYEDMEALAYEIQANADRARRAGAAVTARWRENIFEAVEALRQMVEHEQQGKENYAAAPEEPGLTDSSIGTATAAPAERWQAEARLVETILAGSQPGQQAAVVNIQESADKDKDKDKEKEEAPPSENLDDDFDIVEDEALLRILEDVPVQKSTSEPTEPLDPSGPGAGDTGEPPRPPEGEREADPAEETLKVEEPQPNGEQESPHSPAADEVDLFEQVFSEELATRVKTLRELLEQLIEDSSDDAIWQGIVDTVRGVRDNAFKLDVRQIHPFADDFLGVVGRAKAEPLLRTPAAVEAVRLGIEILQAYLDRDPELGRKINYVLEEFAAVIHRPPEAESSPGGSSTPPPAGTTPAKKNGHGLVARLKRLLMRRVL